MINLKQKIEIVSGKLTSDYKAGMAAPTDTIPYKIKPEYSNQKSELPLTRRERRALKRREKKHGR